MGLRHALKPVRMATETACHGQHGREDTANAKPLLSAIELFAARHLAGKSL